MQFILISAALYRRTLLIAEPFIEGIIYEDRPFNWVDDNRGSDASATGEVFYMYLSHAQLRDDKTETWLATHDCILAGKG